METKSAEIVAPEQLGREEIEKPQRRRRVRRKKSTPKQSNKIKSSNLDNKLATTAVEPETMPSMADLKNATEPNPIDQLDAETESSFSASAEPDSSVTIVGSSNHIKKTDGTRRGWWQKLVE